MASDIITSGYDYIFVPDLPDEYVCVICHCALRSPKQIETCGHRLCDCCLKDLKNWNNLKDEMQCPYDRQSFKMEQVFSDKATERLILNWKVKCTNHECGCQWIGELHSIDHHEESCQYVSKTSDLNLRRRVKELEKQVKSNSKKIGEWEEKYRTCAEELNVCKTELASCKGELTSCKNELATCKRELTSFKNELNVLNNEIKKGNSKVDEKSKSALAKNVSSNQTKQNASVKNATVSKAITSANAAKACSNASAASMKSGLLNGQGSGTKKMCCPILYDEEEFYSACFFNNGLQAFQFGFYFDEDDEDQFCVSLYRCRGKFDDQFDCIQNEFTEGFPLQVKITSNDGEDCTIDFMKNTWTIGYDYYRSLSENYFIGSFDNFDINGYIYLTYKFLS